MILSDKEIKELVKKGVIMGFINLEKQITPNGFDLTVKEVLRIKGGGKLDFSNEERRISEAELLEWEDGELKLEPGVYKIRTNEIMNFPKDLVALVFPRSSLTRNGASIEAGVGDAGFQGRYELLLTVFKPITLKKDARIAQMVFLRMSSRAEREYEGIYKFI